jgi:hypothetical protein
MKNAERAEAARRKAKSVSDQRQKRDDDVKRQIEKERQVFEAKVARLRELRLAKEAADAAANLAEAAPARRKPRSQGAPG